MKITGTVDLVHCNDSRDEFDSGADRHANFGQGRIDPDAWPRSSATPARPSCSRRPAGADEHTADFAFLRERL